MSKMGTKEPLLKYYPTQAALAEPQSHSTTIDISVWWHYDRLVMHMGEFKALKIILCNIVVVNLELRLSYKYIRWYIVPLCTTTTTRLHSI